MAAFWPGPLTVILPRRMGVGTAAAGGNPTIGLRCPSHPVARKLLIELVSEADALSHRIWGLAAPSANQFGRVSPTTASHVQGEFGDDLLILDGGPCDVGIESTIIDCSRGAPVLLRPGAITPEQVQAACGLKVLSKDELHTLDTPAPKVSGTLESHYAPRATVRLMTFKELQTALKLLGQDTGLKGASPTIALYCRSMFAIKTPHVLYRRMPGDASDAAHELFATLRELDAQGIKLIWVEVLPDASEWDGVRDRLRRAAG
jgi:L-threonylcarbamoyladenylate synthase